MMSRVAFSPTFIWVTPSSQPVMKTVSTVIQVAKMGVVGQAARLTLDDLANADLGNKVATTNRAVEPVVMGVNTGPGDLNYWSSAYPDVRTACLCC